MRSLVIFPGALGDLVCLGPALRAIARRYPASRLELMARAELARLAIGTMGMADGHSIDRREVSALFRDGPIDDGARKWFGQFAVIHSFFASDDLIFRRTLSAAAGGPVFFHPFRPSGNGHVARLYLESLGEPSDGSLEFRIDPSAGDLEAADRLLETLGLSPGKYLLVLPGSGSAAKNWPLDRFIALARAMPPSTRPLAVLGPAESGIIAAFHLERIPAVSDLELPVVAALACRSAGFIGNDSGVSHLASASGARGVVIFGPTDPARWAPLGDVTVVRGEPISSLGLDEVLNIVRTRLVCSFDG